MNRTTSEICQCCGGRTARVRAHAIGDLLLQPVLALDAAVEAGQGPGRILGRDAKDGRRDHVLADLADARVAEVDLGVAGGVKGPAALAAP